jgi:hypothetical protein
VTPDVFRRFWNDPEYERLLRRVNEAAGAVTLSKNLTLRVSANEQLAALHGTEDPFEGIIEVWWEHGRGLVEFARSRDGTAMRTELNQYEERFIDLTRSRFFFTEST